MTAVDNYFPFSSGNGAQATQAKWRSMARLFYGTGVVPGNGAQFTCTISGTTVTVQSGACWIDGFYGESLGNKTILNVTGAGTIVARMDPTNANIYFAYITTALQVNPVGLFDVPLYSVSASRVLTDIRQFGNSSPNKVAKLKAYKAANYSPPSGASGMIFDAVAFGSGLSGGSFTAPYAADYHVVSQISVQAANLGLWMQNYLEHGFYTSGSFGWVTVCLGSTFSATAISNVMLAVSQDIVPMAAGDQLRSVINLPFANQTIIGGSGSTFMTVRALS